MMTTIVEQYNKEVDALPEIHHQGGGGAGSNQTRGIISFGMSTDGNANDLNILEFVTFSTSGNAQDFGDLRGVDNAVHTRHISPVSDSHGGLGGY